MKVHVALVGLRGSGKTSLGRRLALELGRPFVNVDDEIVRLHAAQGYALEHAGSILRALGEPHFRDLESRALVAALAKSEPLVLATGGGTIERAENRAVLRERARCLWLQVPIDEIARRLRADPTPRPALLGGDPIEELAVLESRRRALYAEVADGVLDAGTRAPDACVRAALEALDLGGRGTDFQLEC